MEKSPYKVLMALKKISGTNAKAEYLKKHDSELLRNVVKHAVDPMITFGVKQYEFSDEPAEHGGFLHDLKYMDFALTQLSNRGITGNAAQSMIDKASTHLNIKQRYVFACILDKDLKCGVSVKTVNKAFPGMIKVWDMQKAHPLKMKKVIYPAIAEIKENGRGNNAMIIGKEVIHYSNEGRVWEHGAIFNEELLWIADGIPCVIYGEVRGRRGKGTDQYRASQTFRGKDPDMSNAVFVIWDMIMIGEYKRRKVTDDRTQKVRSRRLKDHVRTMMLNHDQDEYKVVFARQKIVNSERELNKLYAHTIGRGLEGLIVKNMNAPYVFSRNYNWMKMKQSESDDLRVVAVKEGKGKLKGTLGSVVVKRHGVKIDCPMGKGVNRDIAKKLWKAYRKKKKSIIGKVVEVKYQNVTPDGSLHLPKFLRIRDDKDMASDEEKPKKKKKKVEKKKKDKNVEKKSKKKKKSKKRKKK